MTNDKSGAGYWNVGAIMSTRRNQSATNFEVVCLFSALGLVLTIVVLMLSGYPEMFDAFTLIAY